MICRQPNCQKMGVCQIQIFPQKKKRPPIKIKGAGRGRDYYCNHRVHIYLTDEEYDLLKAFITSRNPYNHSISDAGRRLLDWALRQWDNKGRKELT